MANFEKQICEKFHDNNGESDTDTCNTDDSQEDPDFDMLEETQSSFSNLSLKKKKSNIFKGMVDGSGGDLHTGDIDITEIPVLPELDEKYQKIYEVIQKVIEVGQVEKLKVDQCKVYLRKHGLRLTGNKDTLIKRIKEHLEILNGGEKKYPAFSFALNCKGDACMGDVVMFEQNVYEMFNVASRSATGPPCGTRVVAGRIVKESYGAAKQQHTYTIEVLWSKGEKPLPPLHPLLIKGRNLYKLKTMRQRWDDEGERHKILLEKHARGCLARSDREARIQDKEMRKMIRAKRVSKIEDQGKKQKENKVPTFQTQPVNSQKLGSCQHQEKQKVMAANIHQGQNCQPKQCGVTTSNNFNHISYKRQCYQQNNNINTSKGPYGRHIHEQNFSFNPSKSSQVGSYDERNRNSNSLRAPLQRYSYDERAKFHPPRRPFLGNSHENSKNFNRASNPFSRQGNEQRQLCRYYAQGWCFYGEHCKYLH